LFPTCDRQKALHGEKNSPYVNPILVDQARCGAVYLLRFGIFSCYTIFNRIKDTKVVLFETKVAGTKQTLKNGSYRLFVFYCYFNEEIE
jgi:hypothetical protein